MIDTGIYRGDYSSCKPPISVIISIHMRLANIIADENAFDAIYRDDDSGVTTRLLKEVFAMHYET